MPPILPIVLAQIAGIISARFLQFSFLTWWGLLGISVLGAFWKDLRFWPILLAILCIAGLRWNGVYEQIHDDPLRPLQEKELVLELRSVEEPSQRGETERFLAKVTRLRKAGVWRSADVWLLTYSPKPFPAGSRIIAEGTLEALPKNLLSYREKGCHESFRILRILSVSGPRGVLMSWPAAMRARIDAYFMRVLSPRDSQVASAVFFGHHRDINRDLLDDFRVTGTYHVLVASGLKVALIGGGIWLITFLFPFYLRVVLSGFFVMFYACLIGFEPPILRATVMALLGFLGYLLGRGRDSLSAILLAALLLLFLNPTWFFDVGFQLSFLSVLGIILFYDKARSYLSFFPKWIADSVGVTLSAQILILAPLVFYFHNLSFVSPLANLIAVPLTGISMGLSATGFVIQSFSEPLGTAVAFWHHLILGLLVWIVKFCAGIPFAYRWVEKPSIFVMFLSYLAVVGLLFIETRKGKILAGSCFLLLLIRIGPFRPLSHPRIVFLDVGQGDSTLICLQNKWFLIDGGGSRSEISPGGYSVGESKLVPQLRAHGVNDLDGILLTHPHVDHVGGLIAVIKHFQVKQIWLPPLTSSSPTYAVFLNLARRSRVPLVAIHGDQKIRLAEDVWLYLYWPIRPFLRETVSDLNNNSVVSQLVVDRVKILLSGDVEIEGENGLLEHLHPQDLLQSQILKVPHHGSGTSSTPDFLRAVRPDVAIVSVGTRNLYHHPSPRTMYRLRRIASLVFRTDQDGTVEFVVHSKASPPWLKKESSSTF